MAENCHLKRAGSYWLGALWLAVATLLAGCGGGGGDSSSPPPKGLVDISAIVLPSTGASASFSLSGQLVATVYSATATLNYSVGAQTTFNGEDVYPVDTTLTLRVPSQSLVVTSGSTAYAKADGTAVGSVRDDGVTCIVTSASTPVLLVEVGDSGFNYTATCSDGSTLTSRWRADAGNGTLDLVYIYRSENGADSYSEEDTWRLNADGIPQSVRAEGTVFTSSGPISFDLQGPATFVNL
jgi:hypothetical protein